MSLPRIEGETYFNNDRPGYDELRDWTPTYYQKIKEDEKLNNIQSEKEVLRENLEKLFNEGINPRGDFFTKSIVSLGSLSLKLTNLLGQARSS